MWTEYMAGITEQRWRVHDNAIGSIGDQQSLTVPRLVNVVIVGARRVVVIVVVLHEIHLVAQDASDASEPPDELRALL